MDTPLQPLAGRLFALRVLLVAAAVPWRLRRPLTRLASWLEPAASAASSTSETSASLPPPPPGAVEAMVARIDRLLQAGRPLIRSGCLTRGITLYYFLRRAGADVALCFGMGEVEGSFAGHCWVVHGGLPLAEKRDPRPLFTEMFRLPSADVPGEGSLAAAGTGSLWRA